MIDFQRALDQVSVKEYFVLATLLSIVWFRKLAWAIYDSANQPEATVFRNQHKSISKQIFSLIPLGSNISLYQGTAAIQSTGVQGH